MNALKRLLVIVLCFSLLGIPAQARQPEKLVALTFDDGPSGRFTRKLLDGLEEWGVKATFLLCGYRMEQYPDILQRIYEEGHEIGLHGYSHKSMEPMCKADVIRDIQKTRALLPEDCKAVFLRPPGGLTSKITSAAAKAEDLSLLHWSVDPKDWATHDAAAIERQVVLNIQDGDIILLHDMSDSSVNAALAIIAQLREQGFRFVTVSELAKTKGVKLQPGVEYSKFG